MKFATHTPEFLAARAPLLTAYLETTAEHWPRYLSGKITHFEYCELIQPAFDEYVERLEPHWMKAGGTRSPKRKKEVNEARKVSEASASSGRDEDVYSHHNFPTRHADLPWH